MEMTYEALAKRIDHSLLPPTLTDARARRGMSTRGALSGGQRVHQTVRACRWPPRSSRARALLSARRSASRTAATDTAVKVFEAERAMDDGATELDMVVNIGQALGGEWDAVRAISRAVIEAAHARRRDRQGDLRELLSERRAEGQALPDLRRGECRLRENLDRLSAPAGRPTPT